VKHAGNSHPECHISNCRCDVTDLAIPKNGVESFPSALAWPQSIYIMMRVLLLPSISSLDFQVPPPAVQHAGNSHPECHISKCYRNVAEPAVAKNGMKQPSYEAQQVVVSPVPIHPWYCPLQDLITHIHCTKSTILEYA